MRWGTTRGLRDCWLTCRYTLTLVNISADLFCFTQTFITIFFHPQGTILFGNKLQLDLSKKHIRITNAPLEFKLDDGTNSVKDYISDWRLNRCSVL